MKSLLKLILLPLVVQEMQRFRFHETDREMIRGFGFTEEQIATAEAINKLGGASWFSRLLEKVK